MAGRPKDPKSPYRVFQHLSNGYQYGSTVQTVYSNEGKRIRKITHWGSLSRELAFKPNLKFIMLPRDERDKFIFPSDWDISAVNSLNSAVPDPEETAAPSEPPKESEMPPAKTPAPAFPSHYEDKLYGAVWFLTQIAEMKHVVEDLMITFEYKKSVVNDILTMAIFPYLTRKNFDRLARDQRIRRYPSENILTSSYITALTQHITPQNRMDFCRLRIRRQPEGAFFACDSTTRSAWGNCIAEIHFGRNKDNKEMNCTLEVVVYSLTTHEPVYYRMFPGNEPDARTLRTINEDLRHLGITRYITVFDRGYESAPNLEDLFRSDFPFIVCAKTAQTPVIDCLLQIKYDETGLPVNMQYDPESMLYCAQFRVENQTYTDSEGTVAVVSGNDYKCNVFLNLAKRMYDLVGIERQMADEYTGLTEKLQKGELLSERSVINKKTRFHKVIYTDNTGNGTTSIEIRKNEAAVKKEKAQCGFFSSLSFKAPGDALEMLRAYRTRDEQEKYFEQMKDQMDFHTQDASSQDGRAGRAFILFVALILSSTVRSTWRNSLELKESFTTSLEILDEMEDIRWIRYEDGREILTEFCGQQLSICKAFGITVPPECLPVQEKKAVERKNNPKKRGRKPKDAPAPNKVTVVQC